MLCTLTLLCASGIARPAAAAPSAHFELRLAPGSDDAELVLGSPDDSTLTIEVWVEVDDAPPGALVQSMGMILRTTQGGVVSVVDDYMTDAFTWCVAGTGPNTPASGDITPLCTIGAGTNLGIGAPALYGHFTVEALALGTTSYTFLPTQSMFEVWAISLSDGTVIEDLTGTTEPALAQITVVDQPTVPRSADSDDDGDVDVADYAFMQHCSSLPEPLGPWCLRVDLNQDASVDSLDLMAFANAMTGAAPPKGDLDNDGDVDLVDAARYQLCRVRYDEPGLENYCRFADVDRDGDVGGNDNAAFVSQLTGPVH